MADPAGGPIICHNDVRLENVVFVAGVGVELVDFDCCAPGSPDVYLAQFARLSFRSTVTSTRPFGPLDVDRPARLRLVAETYGLDVDGQLELIAVLEDSCRRGGECVRRRVEAGDPNLFAMWDEMGGAKHFGLTPGSRTGLVCGDHAVVAVS